MVEKPHVDKLDISKKQKAHHAPLHANPHADLEQPKLENRLPHDRQRRTQRPDGLYRYSPSEAGSGPPLDQAQRRSMHGAS